MSHLNAWDSRQKSSGESHFHSQLQRQRCQSHYAAIWEMFYCEYPFGAQPAYMPDEGSACVWHRDAYDFSAQRPDNRDPWTDNELKQFLESKSESISEIFVAMCTCTQGKPLPIGTYRAAFGDIDMPHEALIISYNKDMKLKN